MDIAPKSSRPSRITNALVFVVFTGACFNSDEKLRAGEDAATDSTETGVMYSDETAVETDDNWSGSSETGDTTCRDAIECLVECQYELIANQDPEPDLSCFLECDKGLTVEEALALLKLGECIANRCLDIGECAGPDETTDGGSESDSTDTGPSNEDCLLCIAGHAMDPEPPTCMEEAAACQ